MSRMVGDNEPLPGQRELAIKMDKDCYDKAVARGQQTFTVVEQDITAPMVILRWIELNWETAPISKLRDAFEDALCMKASKIAKKHAD